MRQVGLFMKVTVVWMDPAEQGGEGLCCYLLLLLPILPESLQILLINIPLKLTQKPVFTFKIRSLWQYLTLALATIKIGSRGTFVVVKAGCVCSSVTFALTLCCKCNILIYHLFLIVFLIELIVVGKTLSALVFLRWVLLSVQLV